MEATALAAAQRRHPSSRGKQAGGNTAERQPWTCDPAEPRQIYFRDCCECLSLDRSFHGMPRLDGSEEGLDFEVALRPLHASSPFFLGSIGTGNLGGILVCAF
jgi:hypothetical protein